MEHRPIFTIANLVPNVYYSTLLEIIASQRSLSNRRRSSFQLEPRTDFVRINFDESNLVQTEGKPFERFIFKVEIISIHVCISSLSSTAVFFFKLRKQTKEARSASRLIANFIDTVVEILNRRIEE